MNFLSVTNWFFADSGYMIYSIAIALIIPCLIFSIVASVKVKSTFSKYSGVETSIGLPAEKTALLFLESKGINDVKFTSCRGDLTDHYDPTTSTLAISDSVRNNNSIAALGVICHECGHAIQHKTGYAPLKARSALVPLVNITNSAMWIVFVLGFILGFGSPYTFAGQILISIGLAAMVVSLLFALLTLPTEINASRRAHTYLKEKLTPNEAVGVKRVLNAAAMTYVAGFMMSLVQMFMFLGLFLMGRNRR